MQAVFTENLPELDVQGIIPEALYVGEHKGRFIGLRYNLLEFVGGVDALQNAATALEGFGPSTGPAAHFPGTAETDPSALYTYAWLGHEVVESVLPGLVSAYTQGELDPMMQNAVDLSSEECLKGYGRTVRRPERAENFTEAILTYTFPEGRLRDNENASQDEHVDPSPSGILPVCLPKKGGKLGFGTGDDRVLVQHILGHMLFIPEGTVVFHGGLAPEADGGVDTVTLARGICNAMWRFAGQPEAEMDDIFKANSSHGAGNES